MTKRAMVQDRFDKASIALGKAREEVGRTYSIWLDACERLKRIEAERDAAWGDLIDVVR